MASKSKKLRRWQGLPDDDGHRPSIYLGPCTDATYREISGHLKSLQQYKRLGVQIMPAAAAWLESIGDGLRDKIAADGLCEPRVKRTAADKSIALHVAEYIAGRTDIGERTRKNLQQTEAKLVEHFGRSRTIGSVTVGDAKAFRQWLEGEGYSLATISMFIKKARQFFGDAVDRETLAKNPFLKVKAGSQVNPAKMRYVPSETIEAVSRVAPDLKWRLILAFGRYAGLRCPSELVALMWCDVDFDANRLHIHSDKTRKLGKPERFTPIHPRLAALLAEALLTAPDRTRHIFDCVDDSSNLRTQLGRMCKAAGVKPWPKPFQNLRASCETDFMDSDGLPLACKWIGNTPETAMKHYHLMRDQDFQRVRNRGAESGAEWCRTGVNQSATPEMTTAVSEALTSTCTPMHSDSLTAAAVLVPPRGVEPLSSG